MIETVERRRSSPFPHCTFNKVFSHQVACGLSRCLADRDDWSYRSEPHNRVRTCHWRPDNLPPAIAALLTREVLDELAEGVQNMFGEVFAEKFFVTANKQIPGDGSKVHNDYFADHLDHPFFFTHRLIVYLSPDEAAGRGGVLGLFGSEDPKDLQRIITPRFNTGVAMAMGPRSFHAVSAITAGTRYSLCFSFTNADHRYHV
jgi:hypothetical protein